MQLIKDKNTGNPSVTITGLTISGVFLMGCMVAVLMKILEPSAIGWFCLPFFMFVALYWRKRVSFNPLKGFTFDSISSEEEVSIEENGS